MSAKVYVGNLPWSIRDEQLADLFGQVGEIVSASVIVDRNTDRSRGFGFVEFASVDLAEKAIEEFDGKEIEGRELKVNIAREKTERRD